MTGPHWPIYPEVNHGKWDPPITLHALGQHSVCRIPSFSYWCCQADSGPLKGFYCYLHHKGELQIGKPGWWTFLARGRALLVLASQALAELACVSQLSQATLPCALPILIISPFSLPYPPPGSLCFILNYNFSFVHMKIFFIVIIKTATSSISILFSLSNAEGFGFVDVVVLFGFVTSNLRWS